MAEGPTTIQRATGITFRPGFFLHVETAVSGEVPTKLTIEDETIDIAIAEREYASETDDTRVILEFHRELSLRVERTDARLVVSQVPEG